MLSDYNDIIGVPITFLDKYCPEQFEILGITKTWYGIANKVYPKQTQVGKDGKKSTVKKLNDGPAIILKKVPDNETYYLIDDTIYVQEYARILIRKKQ